MPTLPPRPMTVGPYRLLSRLGGGGMGSVYLAHHPHLDRLVALKVLAPRASGNPLAIARFKQEMAACGRLHHPHIIAATDAGEDDGAPYLVMEFVKGVDLARLLRERGPLPIPDACELARQTAEGLACIERHDLVHRDIKPSNLLLGGDGVLRILDLGLARLEDTGENQEPLTESGQVMGSGDFIAPEQGVASRHVDIRADIYSLGCTLYALLAGKPPFSGPPFVTFYHKIRAHLEEPVPPLPRPEVPLELRDLLARMLAKLPGERVQSPAEAAALLEPFTQPSNLPALLVGIDLEPDVSPAVLPAPEPDPGARTTRADTRLAEETTQSTLGHRRWKILIGILVLLALVLLTWSLLTGLSHRADPPGSERASISYQPGVWYDLLERPPRELQWPREDGTAHWDHDANLRRLWVHCDDIGLLQLADIVHPGFDLEVAFAQTPWVGGLGVFFQGRQPSREAEQVWGGVLFLKRFERSVEAERAPLLRGFLSRNAPDTPLFLDLRRSQSVPRPLFGSKKLTLVVTAAGIQQVAWDDEVNDDRLRDPQPTVPLHPGAHGAVGVFVQNSSAVIQSARLRVHPER